MRYWTICGKLIFPPWRRLYDGAMNVDDRHTDRVDARRATPVHESACDADFEAALAERYRRLSLLTLDLAEEAGEAARCAKAHQSEEVNFLLVDTKGARLAFFDRRLAAMTRAIWAHRVIERLRSGGDSRGWRPDDGWTPRSSRGESEFVVGDEVERKAVNLSPSRHGPAANAANKKDSANAANKKDSANAANKKDSANAANKNDSANAAFIRASAHSRAGMASMAASGESLAAAAHLIQQRSDEKWTPRSSRGESGVMGAKVERDVDVRVETASSDEAALIDSITNDGLGLGAMIDALAEADLAADDCVGVPSPDRDGPVAAAPFPQKAPAAAPPSQSGAEGVSVCAGRRDKSASERAAGGVAPP